MVKYATDITREHAARVDTQCQLDAVGRSQAIISFDVDGTILDANQNFLDAMGYTMAEISGRKHAMFVDAAERASAEYHAFWERLRAGRFVAQVFRRVRKDGQAIWLQASYNPVVDDDGRVTKVVKFATDMTAVMVTADLADDAVHQVQNVAAATEEMSASVQAISSNMALSRQATDDIAAKSTASGEASAKLNLGMNALGKVAGLIAGIAAQVKLLALNATIEASRAGEAGRGFAVVASEVKNLANKTEAATGDIDREIAAIQTLCAEVAAGIRNISVASGRVVECVNGVATAVGEQTEATREIARNSQRAASASTEISGRIRALSRRAA